MKRILKLTQILSILFSLMVGTTFFAPTVSAQLGQAPDTGGLTNPAIGNLGQNTGNQASSGSLFVGYFINLWQAFMTVGALAVIIMFIWGAFDWITAGEASKVAAARQKIVNAIIGLILLVASFVIINFIGFLFFGDNFNILSPQISDPNNLVQQQGGNKQ